MSPSFEPVRGILVEGREAGAFPAATIEVGRAAGPIWLDAVGSLRYTPDSPPCTIETIFDLASLTKVLVTTPLAMHAVGAGHVTLETPVAELSRHWRGADRESVTVRHLLDHSSGLPAHAPLWRETEGPGAFEQAIGRMPLAYETGRQSVYSDLGFILLGVVLPRVTGVTLEAAAEPRASHDAGGFMYRPPDALRPRIAPTEFDAWRGRELVGEVHDENAAALGGVAGHAGLFGTAASVGAYARLVLRTFTETTTLGDPELMERFASKTGVPASSRALGWDTMLPTSSCGTRLSRSAIGHAGFTGTTLWIDHARDLYVALLTNRVHPTRENARLTSIRPRVHDAVVEALQKGD